MGRKKATMNLIGSRSVRCTTLKRRRLSLLKKASELTKLCGKPVCLVVSDGPDNSSPVVWPSQEEAAQMLSMAKSMPEGKKKKKKLVREVTEIQEQVQNQDRENLHLEAMLQIQLKEALGKIDSQLTIMPLSVAPESSLVQPPISEDGERLMKPIHEEGMLWDYETMPGSFDPFGLPSISMPVLLDAPNIASRGGGIIQTQSLNAGAAYACACGGEEKESMQWDGEYLEPILQERINTVLLGTNSNSLDVSMVQPPMMITGTGSVDVYMRDGEHLAPILEVEAGTKDGEKFMLWDYEIMSGPFNPFVLASNSMPALLDAPNVESGGIIQTQSLNSGAACVCGGEEKESMQWDGEHLEPIFEEDCLPDHDGEPLTPILDKYKLMDYLNMHEPSLDLDTARHEASLLEQHIVDPKKMLDAPNELGGIFYAVVASSSERCSTICRASVDVAAVP
ncbi:Agamous-like MADS-box protein AGL86 [Carex littledalei]|uniref:Agamous-like MADS-box protein AGL86 n=1 Tax=Carex littledalei TaxID=544730 RepID=A0A833RAF1_9POAL|nr:Agamous-like MADS-box protein AGL86 [Carex littledalei]